MDHLCFEKSTHHKVSGSTFILLLLQVRVWKRGHVHLTYILTDSVSAVVVVVSEEYCALFLEYMNV